MSATDTVIYSENNLITAIQNSSPERPCNTLGDYHTVELRNKTSEGGPLTRNNLNIRNPNNVTTYRGNPETHIPDLSG